MRKRIINNWVFFVVGILLVVFLAISYLIKIQVDSGANFTTYDSLLGIIIFHNIFVLGFYVLIALIMIVLGIILKKHKSRVH